MNIIMSQLFPAPALRRIAAVSIAAAAIFSGCFGRTTMTPSRAMSQPGNLHPQLGGGIAQIVSLNPGESFVVIDFTSGIVPVVGTRVSVYRNGKQVGVVRITEPMRAEFATADIVEGEVHVGDEAR